MTIDLRRAGPGWTVHFRCGGSAIVRSTYKLSGEQYLGFTEDDAESNWHDDGSYQRSGKLHPFDIIGLDPPPMTEAQMREALEAQMREALAEIAPLAMSAINLLEVTALIGELDGPALRQMLLDILALAEGKS